MLHLHFISLLFLARGNPENSFDSHEVIMYTLRIRRHFFHLDVEPLRLWGKRCYQACVPYSEHIHVWKAMHDLKDWAHLPFLVEKGKGSFLFGRLKNEVTQLLSGSLGLCSRLMVVDSTVERTWSVLHSASGSIRALKGNGEPRKLVRGILVVE